MNVAKTMPSAPSSHHHFYRWDKTIPSHGCFSTNFNQVSPGFPKSPIFCIPKSEIGGKKKHEIPIISTDFYTPFRDI